MLKGIVKKITEYTDSEIKEMYSLMDTFYDDVAYDVFLSDFSNKDYCLALYTEEEKLVGFTTQKVMEIDVSGKKVNGIFSGDTIIHKDYWGDIELFRVWSHFWFKFAEDYEEFYWFLICKGYKTYRMLPLFWTEYYPCYDKEMPEEVKSIIDAYATEIYGDEYNPVTGVVEYKHLKDKLKAGVADIGEKEKRRKEVAFFCEKNPGYINGNDIACLAKIDKKVLKKKIRELLFNEP